MSTFEERIAKTVTKKLNDGTVEELVSGALTKALKDSIEEQFRWRGEAKKVVDEKVKEVEDALADGSLHVFDTSTFTVDGKELTTYKKDGSDTEYVSDGYFHESEYGSAPAFDVAIDGITSITE